MTNRGLGLQLPLTFPTDFPLQYLAFLRIPRSTNIVPTPLTNSPLNPQSVHSLPTVPLYPCQVPDYITPGLRLQLIIRF